ncbi:cytochrome P450 [Umezawaea tangerina]|uniref:Cytochrome P450 n=1 Tax=Umezawaea tangerina TaxID=84725 RepID=A0A2T0T445_9PSEU|nr:cytochrome P450 [Umezawaea tangerina]PRY40450.1 cytochrome P450 [Umezawaea tangerina]
MITEGVTALPAAYGTCPFDPPPAYQRAAESGVVGRAVLPDGSSCWLVTGYHEVRAVLADQRFSADARRPGFPFLSPTQRELATANPSFIRMDDPEHARLRRMVSRDFLVKRVEELGPDIQRVVDRTIDRMVERGAPADLVADFAQPIPSLVICLLLGVPFDDHDLFQSLSATLLDNTITAEQASAAHRELMTYLAGLAERKRAEPGDDILSRLVAREDLTPAETASMGFMLLVTGHETTANQTAMAVRTLLERPDQVARMLASPAATRQAVEELLRYLTLVHLGLARVATEDVEVGGTPVRAGEGLICMLSTANREPELFGLDARDLDVSRDAKRHVAFGHGTHLCLGQALARVELRIALETLFRRLPGLRSAVPAAELAYTAEKIVYGLRALPVTW